MIALQSKQENTPVRDIVDTAVEFGTSLTMVQRKNLQAICDECRNLGASSDSLGPIFFSMFLIDVGAPTDRDRDIALRLSAK